ncbi:pyridoxal phosphate-dependent transferase [Astrocystis sublimbata]|nr:pyridoxal phosphate-dependent transferase [Astrocystis sublimbata]
MFGNRKFSMNKNTGVPRRRFSIGDPSANETSSKIHRQFRASNPGHLPHAGLDPTRASTGVVWCTERAAEHGFLEEPEKWANLGQGAPEVDDEIEGSFPRPTTIDVSIANREYGPTAGIKPLRAAVARMYNEMHRQGKDSQYSWENVAIVPGGRAGLIRIAAVLNNAYVGFFIPDYTAYNEMMSLFKNVSIHPSPSTCAPFLLKQLSLLPFPPLFRKRTATISIPMSLPTRLLVGTSVILTSNPRNPTGRVVANPELAEIQDICRGRATLISDEFYAGYNYTSDCDGTVISAADNIEDVDEDDVLIIDGLTKRFRLPDGELPGSLDPRNSSSYRSCGSYLDGGANAPFQEAAVPMLEPSLVRKEMQALQRHFRVSAMPDHLHPTLNH